MSSKCPTCGADLEVYEAPAPLFSIPFTKLEVLRWERDTCCLECAEEQESAKYEQIYVAGQQDGYEAGLRKSGE